MPPEIKPYVKSLDDELDWKLLDQLFGIVSQISNFCFETKKFCVTTEFIVLTLFAKFTTDKLDTSLFVTGLVIPICFWFLDSVAYYYQAKLRGMMEAIQNRIKDRHKEQLIIISSKPIERINKPWWSKVFDAVINHSMWIYAFLIIIDFIVWVFYLNKVVV
ncbi:MAG: hypothetical protein WCK96_15380 [Methylococcales bacterium]